MKNITKSLLILLGAFAVSCSSDDVEDRAVITPVGAPVLTAPDGGSYTLDIADAALQADRFVWTSADFDEDVAITYTLELDKAGDEFDTPQSLGSVVGENSLSVSVESLNNAVMGTGAVPFESAQFEVRVKASVSDSFEPMYSEAITISVTPYTSVVPPLYLVGQSQEFYELNAWDNTTAMEMRYIGDGITKVYECYVKVGLDGEGNPAGFKFIGEQGTWDNGNYGTVGGVQDGNLENSGASGNVTPGVTDGVGLYYVWADIDNMKYKTIKMEWGIIGSSTTGAWDSETPMTYDFESNTYSLTTTLTDGELKFRSGNTGTFISGNAWQFNVGNSDPKVTYNPEAPNFAVTAGSHDLGLKINFDGTAEVTGL